ncbi:YdcF family protein [Rhodococcus sp. IEGM 1379]|uniref:YdcF family protein n=1 Tax=Rhodococcus sp. IEGM 1379 TaxID=3047086 RepID=UPI0024B762CA|nr:YdcF family protein [Rhodococcus sp. IEGM 1379]MDI9913922.1 YdcF family protein [Rhodococcus sp. IEGM 1379]
MVNVRTSVLKGIAAAALVAAAGVGLSPATASADITPVTVVNGVLSVFGGCQSTVREVVVVCTGAESLTRRSPLLLDLNPAGTNIVVLGAGLFDDGTMRPMLVERLQAALEVAHQYPAAPIITSGGAPKSGITEAKAMRDWLVANGIDPARITEEGRSGSTVQNAQNTAQILADRRASGVVVVSSANHVERAMIDFRMAVGGGIPVAGVIAAT